MCLSKAVASSLLTPNKMVKCDIIHSRMIIRQLYCADYGIIYLLKRSLSYLYNFRFCCGRSGGEEESPLVGQRDRHPPGDLGRSAGEGL